MHLIVMACLLSNPQSCAEYAVPTQALLPMECFAAMGEWAVAHPTRRVMWFRCAPPQHRA